MNVRCYVINLDHKTERWEWMRQQLEASGLPFSRVSAIVGRDLPDETIASHRSRSAIPLSPNEVGCLLSHAKTWRAILDGDEDIAIVMEDDLHISHLLYNFVANIEFGAEERQLIKIEATPMWYNVKRRPTHSFGSYNLHELKTRGTNSGAYIINKVSANCLLSLIDFVTVPIDWLISNPETMRTLGIRVLQTLPSPCIQDNFVSSTKKQSFESDIGQRGTIEMRSHWIAKEAIKPIFRLLFSAALSLKGERRAASKFA